MNRKSLVSLTILVVLGISSIAMIVPVLSTLTPVDPDPLLLDENLRRRINSAPINADFSESVTPASVNNARLKMADSAIGDVKLWLTLDDFQGVYFFTFFELYSQSANGEVWVQLNRDWPDGSGKDNSQHDITHDQTDYLVNEFETNIYAQEAAFYGTPGYQDGSFASLPGLFGVPDGASMCELVFGLPASYCDWNDANGRTAIMVANVRDDNYYTDFPLYIAGFYSSQLDAWFDRNVMTIDSFDWVNRVGPDGSRPFLYEGVFAHEYQHLIHSDYVGSSSFINEGFSDYAEYLVGYGAAFGHINDFMAKPQNSLTEWGDMGPENILADYGAAALMTHYLEDHFPGYQSTYMQNGIPDIAGMEQAVADVSGHNYWTFEKLFHNWQLANLIQKNWGPYSYDSIDYEQLAPLNVQELVDGAASGASNTLGTNYVLLDNDPYGLKKGKYRLTFDGDESSIVPQDPGWTLDEDGFWYGGT
ncbi:MAG: hypothetical protein ACW99Q_28710, partial [Candidatus Kariarchaeaceae archaeon]